jgi:hypothetical protein
VEQKEEGRKMAETRGKIDFKNSNKAGVISA